MVKKLVRDLDDFDKFILQKGDEYDGTILSYSDKQIGTNMSKYLPGDWIEVLAWDDNGDAWDVYYRLDEEVEVVEEDG